MGRPSFLFWLLVLVVSVRVAAVWDALPETMASHFDVSGRPDGWASREAFVLAVGGITLLVLLPLTWPGWLRRLPVSWINVPYKEYWWPDRWDEAVVILGKYLGWFALATAALLAFAVELVLRANLAREGLDGGAMLIALGGYLGFALLWMVGLFRALRPPRNP